MYLSLTVFARDISKLLHRESLILSICQIPSKLIDVKKSV